MSIANKLASVLLRFGRPMTLRRNALGPIVNGSATQVPLEVTVYGVSRGYKPQELLPSGGGNSGITQLDIEVTLSNAEIAAAQWPGPPKKGDMLVFEGKNTTIQAVEPKNLGTELLVYVCQTRGS